MADIVELPLPAKPASNILQQAGLNVGTATTALPGQIKASGTVYAGAGLNVGTATTAATGQVHASGDIECLAASKGLILTDRGTGTRYRLYVNGGALAIEVVP